MRWIGVKTDSKDNSVHSIRFWWMFERVVPGLCVFIAFWLSLWKKLNVMFTWRCSSLSFCWFWFIAAVQHTTKMPLHLICSTLTPATPLKTQPWKNAVKHPSFVVNEMWHVSVNVFSGSHYYGRPLSVSGRPCYILPMFYLFIFFMAALFSGPG